MLHTLTLIQAYFHSPIPWLLKISATPFIPLFIKTVFYFGTKSIDWDEAALFPYLKQFINDIKIWTPA